MMAPMPRAVSDHGPKVLLNRCAGSSDSEISLSIDLQQKAWLLEVRTTATAGSVDGGGNRRSLLSFVLVASRAQAIAYARHCLGLSVLPDRGPVFSPCAF